MKPERLVWSKAITSCERRYPYLFVSLAALAIWMVILLGVWVAVG